MIMPQGYPNTDMSEVSEDPTHVLTASIVMEGCKADDSLRVSGIPLKGFVMKDAG